MFFRTQNGGVYHILEDEMTGAAPCGKRMTGYELYQLREGKPTQLISAEKPEDTPLCKHCEKREDF
jgi:hypothetical protein